MRSHFAVAGIAAQRSSPPIMSGEPPPPSAQVDAFARLMGSSKRGRAPTPAPPGRIPKGKKWDEWNGVWVNIDSTAATTTDANEDEDDSDPDQPVVDASSAKRRDRYRPYKSSWKAVMPFLVLISTLSGYTACPSKEGASCVGCRECARLFCTECQLKGKDNTYTRGCKNFHMGGCRTHMSIHHPPRQQGKSPIAEGLAKAVQAHAEKIQGIMYNVYLCAKRNIALHNIGYISDLCELHGVCLGKHYNHEVAAREFLICIADVIRAEIIEAARSSPCLGLMVDESTDVSKIGASVIV